MQTSLNGAEITIQSIVNNFPQFVFWKDIHSTFLGCNGKFSEAVGLDSPCSIVGKTDFDMPWAKNESDAYINDDKTIVTTGLPKLNYIELQQQRDKSAHLMLVNKMPLYNALQKIVGVMGMYVDITEHHSMLSHPQNSFLENSDISFFSKDQISAKSKINNVFLLSYGGHFTKLTKREAECIALLYHGLNNKLIAKKLNISYRTVEEYFSKIKTKLGCKTRLDIYRVAFHNPHVQSWYKE